MSVANSGIFTIVNAIQTELAELAESIPAAVNLDTINASITTLNTEVTALNNATQILYNWQFRGGNPNGGFLVPAGPLPAGVYAATGFVTITDSAFTFLRVQINGGAEETFSDYAYTTFSQAPHSIIQYTMPISYYFKVDNDLPSVNLDIASDMSSQGSITASVQIYKVNQAWPTPLAPIAPA